MLVDAFERDLAARKVREIEGIDIVDDLMPEFEGSRRLMDRPRERQHEAQFLAKLSLGGRERILARLDLTARRTQASIDEASPVEQIGAARSS